MEGHIRVNFVSNELQSLHFLNILNILCPFHLVKHKCCNLHLPESLLTVISMEESLIKQTNRKGGGGQEENREIRKGRSKDKVNQNHDLVGR